MLFLYIFLWCVFNSGIITNPTVSVMCLGFLFLVSFFYMGKVALAPKNNVISILFIFVILLSIYGILFIISGESLYLDSGLGRSISNREFLIQIYQSILPIFPFYYFACQGKLTVELMKKWIIVFFIIALIAYVKNQYKVMIDLGIEHDGLTNNGGYYFLSLFPILTFLNKNKWIQHILFVLCLILIILSVKRGAIALGIVAYLWFILNSSEKLGFSRLRTIILLCFASVVVYAMFTHLISTNEYFLFRYEETLEGKTSGREHIYQSLINTYFLDSSFFQQLFGRGAYGTLKIADNVAHSDWLELLIDLGLLGFGVYLIYWIKLLKAWFSSKVSKEIYLALGLFIIIYFSKTFFSMSYNGMTVYSTIVLGYCLAHIPRKDNVNNLN